MMNVDHLKCIYKEFKEKLISCSFHNSEDEVNSPLLFHTHDETLECYIPSNLKGYQSYCFQFALFLLLVQE